MLKTEKIRRGQEAEAADDGERVEAVQVGAARKRKTADLGRPEGGRSSGLGRFARLKGEQLDRYHILRAIHWLSTAGR